MKDILNNKLTGESYIQSLYLSLIYKLNRTIVKQLAIMCSNTGSILRLPPL